MKKSILTRVLAALGGVTLWALGLCALAETFFHVQVTGRIGQLLGARTPLAVLITLLLAIALCAFGVSCLMMLSTKRAVKRTGCVMQKGENVVIGGAVKSIEGLVQTCVRQHDTVHSAEIAVVERRDGIVILLNIQEAAGVNIPLAVGALQKQIKQYVNECTGVDVHEVRVMVENTEDSAVASPYAVKEPVVMTTAVTAAELQREAADEAAEPVQPVEEASADESVEADDLVEEIDAPAEEVRLEEAEAEESVPEETISEEEVAAPVVQPVPSALPVMPELAEEADDRPLHQRLFGMEDEPVFVPAPPELVIEPAAEEIAAAEEIVAPAEEPAEEDIPQEDAEETEMDAFAVLEVVEAVSEEIAEEIAAAEEIVAPVEESDEVEEESAEDEAEEDGSFEEADEIINE